MKQNQTMTEPLVKEVILDATPARVWKALTNKEELKQWCFDMNAFEPRPGFAFEFYGEKDGRRYKHLCKVLEVEKEKRMKWLWAYEGMEAETFVTFELFPEGDQTRLRLTHEGLENLPQDENYAKKNFMAGWNSILDVSLKNYLKA
jgi:uncharacterized protein YndB with AHSA1/START domain